MWFSFLLLCLWMLQIHNRYADVMRRQLNTAVHKKQQSQATRNRICIHGIIPDFIKKEQGEKKKRLCERCIVKLWEIWVLDSIRATDHHLKSSDKQQSVMCVMDKSGCISLQSALSFREPKKKTLRQVRKQSVTYIYRSDWMCQTACDAYIF